MPDGYSYGPRGVLFWFHYRPSGCPGQTCGVHWQAGASTPYKPWSKCSIIKLRGKVFQPVFQPFRGKLIQPVGPQLTVLVIRWIQSNSSFKFDPSKLVDLVIGCSSCVQSWLDRVVGGGQLATVKAADSVVQCHVTVPVSTPTPSLLTSFSELTILATERDLVMA